jgi:hypothetical protein
MKKGQMKIWNHRNYKEYFDSRYGAIDSSVKCAGEPTMELERRHGPVSNSIMLGPMRNGLVPMESRLLGATHFKHLDFEAALRAGGIGLQGHLVSGGKAAHPEEDTSVLPAWRTTLVHMIGGGKSFSELQRIAPFPESGAYSNEASNVEQNWKEAFWGINYARLSDIKTKYDPDNLFWVSPGINADHMELVDGRLCKRRATVESSMPPQMDFVRAGRNFSGITTGGADDCWRQMKPPQGKVIH